MEFSSQAITVIATLGGAIVGALPGLVTSLLNQRADARRQLNELVVKAAIESWKTQIEHGRAKAILPLEHFIIHTAMMSEIALSKKKITPEIMANHLREVSAVMDVLVDHAKSIRTDIAGK